jgi:peptide/nickel transport system ATP-binding protein
MGHAMEVPGEATFAPTRRHSRLLEVEALSVAFATDHGWTRVVDNVTFNLDRGETLGLVGESGSGKSVTAMAVMGLIPEPPGRVESGTITLAGEELTALSERELQDRRGAVVSMVFQEPMTSLNPAFTVGEQVAETVRRHQGVRRRAAMDRAAEMLDLVGIPDARRRLHSYPHEYSGGMRQRAMIAMALACDPKLLIADEPTTALDVTIQAQVLDLLRDLRREFDMAILFVTHDLGVVADICDRVVVMYAGQLIEEADVDRLFDQPLHPYTEGLLLSMPQMGASGGHLNSIPGGPPSPWDLPPGCRFAPRCRYAIDACVQCEPSLLGHGDARWSRCIRADDLQLRGSNDQP